MNAKPIALLLAVVAGTLTLPSDLTAQQDTRELRERFIRTNPNAEKKKAAPAVEAQPAPAAKPAAAAQPAAAKPAAAETRTQQQGGKTKAESSALGEFNFQSDQKQRFLRIHPQGARDRQDMQVIIGDEFVTEVSFDNTDLRGFNKFRILLAYEPDFLEPVELNDTAIADYIIGEPTSELDPLFGQILYEVELNRSLALNNSPIIAIKWKALKVNLETNLEFGQREEIYSTVIGGVDEEDLLGSPKQPGDGTLNMTVTILPEDPREAAALLTDPRTFSARSQKIGGVRLLLKPPDDPIIIDEPFFVDLILDNRAFSNLDALRAVLNYDSDVLEILDADLNNPITLGINLHDGPFTKNYPWNYHIDNTVFPIRGEIHYRMGTDDQNMTRGKVGTVARLYAVARKPTAATAITFQFNDSPRARATEVLFVGQDVLGDPDINNDGAQGVVLRINPKKRTAFNQ